MRILLSKDVMGVNWWPQDLAGHSFRVLLAGDAWAGCYGFPGHWTGSGSAKNIKDRSEWHKMWWAGFHSQKQHSLALSLFFIVSVHKGIVTVAGFLKSQTNCRYPRSRKALFCCV